MVGGTAAVCPVRIRKLLNSVDNLAQLENLRVRMAGWSSHRLSRLLIFYGTRSGSFGRTGLTWGVLRVLYACEEAKCDCCQLAKIVGVSNPHNLLWVTREH